MVNYLSVTDFICTLKTKHNQTNCDLNYLNLQFNRNDISKALIQRYSLRIKRPKQVKLLRA